MFESLIMIFIDVMKIKVLFTNQYWSSSSCPVMTIYAGNLLALRLDRICLIDAQSFRHRSINSNS